MLAYIVVSFAAHPKPDVSLLSALGYSFAIVGINSNLYQKDLCDMIKKHGDTVTHKSGVGASS